jgi:hypothetical protein
MIEISTHYLIGLVVCITVLGSVGYVVLTLYDLRVYAQGCINIPIKILSALVVVVLIASLLGDTKLQKKQNERTRRNDLSNYAQRVIVDRWETEPAEHPELASFYDDVHLAHLSPPDAVIRATLERAGVPYVRKADNPRAWHFAAKFIQEMVNVVRTYELDEKFVINDTEAFDRVIQSPYAGWFACMRSFMSNATVRNVWERYKYRHSHPYMSAWTQFYIVDPIEDPEFWASHHRQWDTYVKQFRNRSPEDMSTIIQDLYRGRGAADIRG